MNIRNKMKERYRRFSWLSDLGGIKNALGEMRGIGFPQQPDLNKEYIARDGLNLDEEWFVKTLRDKFASHPENTMEFPLT